MRSETHAALDPLRNALASITAYHFKHTDKNTDEIHQTQPNAQRKRTPPHTQSIANYRRTIREVLEAHAQHTICAPSSSSSCHLRIELCARARATAKCAMATMWMDGMEISALSAHTHMRVDLDTPSDCHTDNIQHQPTASPRVRHHHPTSSSAPADSHCRCCCG